MRNSYRVLFLFVICLTSFSSITYAQTVFSGGQVEFNDGTTKTGELAYRRDKSGVQGDGNYTIIHYPDGATLLASTTLKLVSAWYPNMIQVRKGVAINPEYVVSYNKYSAKGLTVHLEFANTRIAFEASRRRVASVEEAILVHELSPYFQDY